MKRNTKELLIEKGEELLSKKEYYDTKVEDITKEAGVAKGTFYIYFESKEDMYMEIILKKIKEHSEDVKKIIADNNKFRDRIEKLTEAFINLLFKNMGFFRSFFKISQMDSGTIGNKIREVMVESHNLMIKNIERFFEEAVNNGEISEKYREKLTDLAIMYETLRSEYVIRKLLNMSGACKKSDCAIIFNKLGAIQNLMNEEEIAIEAKFITDIFLGGIQK